MGLDPDLLRQGAAGIVPPALVAGGVLLGARRWPPVRGSGAARRAVPLAVGLGTFAGFVATHGWPGDPRSADVKESIAYAALVLGALGALTGGTPSGAGVRARSLLVAALAACCTAWYVLDFMRAYHWKGAALWCWPLGLGLAGSACAGALSWRAPGDPARRPAEGTWEAPALVALACALAAGALLLGRSASLAQLAGALAVTHAVCAALRAPLAGLGGVLPSVLLLQALLWAGHFAAELPAAGAVAAGLAPLGIPAGRLGPWAGSARARRAVSLLLVLLAAGGGLWLAGGTSGDDPYAAYR